MRNYKVIFLLFIGLGFANASLYAEFNPYEPERILKLADRLNGKDWKMFNYSVYALKQAIARAPENVETLKIKLAETYILWNKQAEGEKIISAIPKSSKYYSKGQFTLGVASLNRGKLELGVKLLKNYVDSFKEVTDEDTAKDFRQAVGYLNWAYKQLNQSAKAESILNQKDKIQISGLSDADKKTMVRENNFYKIRTLLDSAEKLMEQETSDPEATKKANEFRVKMKSQIASFMNKITRAKDPSKKIKLPKELENDYQLIAHSVMPRLADLRWFQDVITSFSYVQKARALYLLGRYDDALKELNLNPSLIKACDSAFREDGMASEAPGAGVRFWMGKIYMAKAKQAEKPKEKEKLYITALTRFLSVMVKFKGYARSEDAMSGLLECKDVLEKEFDRSIKLPKLDVKVKSVKLVDAATNNLFNDGKYDKAIPKLVALFHKHRRSKGNEDVLQKLGYSYAKAGDTLEAMAVAQYMADYCPESEISAVGLLQVGQILWEGATKVKDPKESESRKDEAMRVYVNYLDCAPEHQYAGAISARVAKEKFDRAATVAKAANKLRGKEKQVMVEKAIASFKEAIPDYQRIVDNYAHTEYGNSSYYLMAVCYSSSKQFVEAAKVYQVFCDREQKDITKIADAKLRVADNYYQAGQHLDKKAREIRDDIYQIPAVTETDKEKTAEDKAPAADDKKTLEKAPDVKVDPKVESKEGKKAEVKEKSKKTPPKPQPKPDEAKDTEKKTASKKEVKKESKKEAKKEEAAPEKEEKVDAKESTVKKEKPVPAPEAPKAPVEDPRIKEVEQMEKDSKLHFTESVKQLKELINEWYGEGGRLADLKKYKLKAKGKEKIARTRERAYELLAWAYDGAGKKNEACAAFADYIKKFPKSEKIPGCMLRMGVIYTETNEDDKAENILNELVKKFPESPEGKNAPFLLGRSLFNNGKYPKAISEFGKIFDKNLEASISSMRWIASHLLDCDKQNKKAAALVVGKACDLLLKELKKPELKDWIGQEQVKQVKNDPAKLKELLKIINQKLLYDAANAAFWAEDYNKSVEFLDQLLEDDKTPYLFIAKFLRADAYFKLEQYKKARKDLGDVNMNAMAAGKDGTQAKAQCLVGESYISENNFDKALGAFFMLAKSAGLGEDAALRTASSTGVGAKVKKIDPEEKKLEDEWLEHAVYRAAYCAAKLGKEKEKKEMSEKYEKLYPKGKYIGKIKDLPAAEAANKE